MASYIRCGSGRLPGDAVRLLHCTGFKSNAALLSTATLPLAALIIDEGAHVLSARRERFTADITKPRRNMRDSIATMHTSGIQFARPPRMSNQGKLQFANQFYRWPSKQKLAP